MKLLTGFLRTLLLAPLLVLAAGVQADSDAPSVKTLKVCRDPNNLPMSNGKGEGYEDKIAQVLANDLGWKLEFFEFAGRFNFIRNTLKFKLPSEAFRCDLVIGVPVGFDQVSATKPYFRTTYALVVAQGRKLDGVKTVEDLLALPADKQKGLHIGVGDKSPGSDWLVNHGLLDLGVPYRVLIADLDQTPAQIMEDDLVSGKLDAAIVWGPIAGYYASRKRVPFVVIPMKSEHGAKFDFDIAMGVRYGEKDWKTQVEQLIDKDKPKILAILSDYGVPLLEAEAPPAAR